MILTARADLTAPLAHVYAELTDMAAHERSALRHGADLSHTGGPRGMAAGAHWYLAFRFRGKPRKVALEVTAADPQGSLKTTSISGGMTLHSTLDLIALSGSATRMALRVKLKPTTLSARLLVQSLKLTRAPVERKFAKRFADFARLIEGRALQRGA